jgi:hypothetical protein
MSNLRSTIDRLASQFAGSIIEALRGASLDELMEVAGSRGGARRGRGAGAAAAAGAAPELAGRRRGRGGRLGRRTADDIARMIDGIVEVVARNPEGLRAEQIREELGVEAKELPRPLADAIAAGRLTKSGQKRATTYFAGSGEGASGGGTRKRAARRGGGRKKKG